jgi:hypothetical protein
MPSAKRKSTHGGKRPGAGRPRGVPTRVLSFRVPADQYAALRAALRERLGQLLAK